MAGNNFVKVDRDIDEIEEKIILGLTKKQLIGFSAALVFGVPVFLTTKSVIGDEMGLVLAMAVMAFPIFLTIYKPPTGNTLKNQIKVYLKFHFISYGVRIYQTNTLFSPYIGWKMERSNNGKQKRKKPNKKRIANKSNRRSKNS